MVSYQPENGTLKACKPRWHSVMLLCDLISLSCCLTHGIALLGSEIAYSRSPQGPIQLDAALNELETESAVKVLSSWLRTRFFKIVLYFSGSCTPHTRREGQWPAVQESQARDDSVRYSAPSIILLDSLLVDSGSHDAGFLGARSCIAGGEHARRESGNFIRQQL